VTTDRIQAIPTTYAGTRMRSKLEANTAAILDAAGIEWLYEAEGFDLDGLWYLPDFYLPKLDAFLEVKGVMEAIDEKKILRLAELSGKDVFIVRGNRLTASGGFPVDAVCQSPRGLSIVADVARVALRVDGQAFIRRMGAQHALRQRKHYGEIMFTRIADLRYAAHRPEVPLVYLGGRISPNYRDDFPGLGRSERTPGLVGRGQSEFGAGFAFPQPFEPVKLRYAGPLIPSDDHGCYHDDLSTWLAKCGGDFTGPGASHSYSSSTEGWRHPRDVVAHCLASIDAADLCFFWLEDYESYGSLVEIGYARGRGKRVAVAFPTALRGRIDSTSTPDSWEDAKELMHGRELWFAGFAANTVTAVASPALGLMHALVVHEIARDA
jgi:nucleoside 2-deoxyribosyltransferase